MKSSTLQRSARATRYAARVGDASSGASNMDTLLIARDTELAGLVTITLNRPDKLNAISGAMHRDIQQACRELQDDAEARVVVFTGAGRAFSAGADLGGNSRESGRSPLPARYASRTALEERLQSSIGNRTAAAIEGLDQVTISAVNGLAIGGAVVILACLDIRLAAQSAWFSIPEVDLDIPLTWNALPRLMRELGPARTKELVMTCDRFSADDALRWGFLNTSSRTPTFSLAPARLPRSCSPRTRCRSRSRRRRRTRWLRRWFRRT